MGQNCTLLTSVVCSYAQGSNFVTSFVLDLHFCTGWSKLFSDWLQIHFHYC